MSFKAAVAGSYESKGSAPTGIGRHEDTVVDVVVGVLTNGLEKWSVLNFVSPEHTKTYPCFGVMSPVIGTFPLELIVNRP